MTNPRTRKRRSPRALATGAVLALGAGALLAPTLAAAPALAATGGMHAGGHVGADLGPDNINYVGSFAMSDGSLAFCIDGPLYYPWEKGGVEYSELADAEARADFVNGDGTQIGPERTAQIAWVMRNADDSPLGHAAAQVATWFLADGPMADGSWRGEHAHVDGSPDGSVSQLAHDYVDRSAAEAVLESTVGTSLTPAGDAPAGDAKYAFTSWVDAALITGQTQRIPDGTLHGTITVTGGTVAGATTAEVTNGQQLEVVADGSGADVKVSIVYTDAPSGRIIVRDPLSGEGEYQRIVQLLDGREGGASIPVEGETTPTPTAPKVTTTVSLQTAQPGAELRDTLHVTGLQPGAQMTVESILVGPLTDAQQPGSVVTLGQDVAEVGRVSTVVTADGDTTTTPVALPQQASAGRYAFIYQAGPQTKDGETITPAFADSTIYATETTTVTVPVTPTTPTVTTTISDQQSAPGDELRDTLHVSGMEPGGQMTVTSILVGPLAEAQQPGRTVVVGQDVAEVGRVSTVVTANGDTTTAPVTLPNDAVAGRYAFIYEVSAQTVGGESWTPPFADSTIYAEESTTVTVPVTPGTTPPAPTTTAPAEPKPTSTPSGPTLAVTGGTDDALPFIGGAAAVLLAAAGVLVVLDRRKKAAAAALESSDTAE